MKKLISGLSALAIMAMPLTAFADTTIDETTPTPKQGKAVITTEIAPSYIVTIPADTAVKFNALTTDFGKVELTKAQIEPGKAVKVTVNSDGELNNAADEKKVIPYTVMAQYASGAEGEEDWNKAYAGKYSDTVTFGVEYTDATPEA